MGLLADAAGSFALGLATPLTAVCVLPLYPGFLAYLANQGGRVSIAQLAGLVAVGVLAFMSGLGVVFATVLEVSLTRVVGVVSPAAFGLLALLSLALLADVSVARFLPAVEPPQSRSPRLSALAYGLFFGAIVVPCNPGLIAVFFARSFLFETPLVTVANFGAFGTGMAAPLVGLALVSEAWRDRVLDLLTSHRSAVNRLTGLTMLAVSLYYLVVVFEVFG